ncbi:photosystem II subunit X [Forsythia ovata]|uniref:Photosystem II subunit X n=1 Tax=Forsythia ovata TaxID=205694 RepID=A0ABD1SN65_9LAMI
MAASTSAVSMAMPLTRVTRKTQPNADAFLKPLPVKTSNGIAVSKSVGKFEVKASLKEKMVTGLTAGALTASMVVPDVAEAASGVSPSLKNFLLSIVAGGVVLGAILGAVIGVSNFDPVKRS